MFFRKETAADVEARAAQRRQIQDEVDKRFAEMEAIQDPAEKILKLEETRRYISDSSYEVRNAAEMTAVQRGLHVGGMVYGAFLVAGLGLAVTVNPLFLGLMIVGLFSGMEVDFAVSDREQKRLDAENKEFVDKMERREEAVRPMEEAIADSNLSAIAKSPKADEVMRAMWGLREKFVQAFRGNAANGDTPAAQRPEVPKNTLKL